MSEPIKNILKVREDSKPLILEQAERSDAFSINEDQTASSWFPKDKKNEINPSDLRVGIEPWLTSLFQSEHLSLLVGSGLTTAAHVIATGKPDNAMTEPELHTGYKYNITTMAKIAAGKQTLKIIYV